MKAMKSSVYKIRDLTIVNRGGSRSLVIACDSSAGIGNKPMDAVQTTPEIVGYYTARVAVMEVLSVGADVLTVVDTLAVESKPTGEAIIRGIEQLLNEAGLTAAHVNGSTEENFVSCQTGIGITVIGEAGEKGLKLKRSTSGDCMVMLGEPLVGEAVMQHPDRQCSIRQLQLLTGMSEVHEIHPVGSKGAGYEAQLLAELNGLRFQASPGNADKLNASGGPATAVIFSAPERALAHIQAHVGCKLELIGHLRVINN
ncbi:AIR synthase related protein [Paenibacillus tengchongensis]|uniref:AIR synthase related protein n=1 Tax=Paenibacillus tengchongensis TaxID=2608684 RepID=UPI00124D79B3|nr:AIR synthase related protein [Paenibacillus tengchongensis]